VTRGVRIKLRRAIGWIAAYALALQTILASAVLAPPASADPSLAFDPAAIICLTNGGPGHAAGPADELPAGSGQHSHVGGHCGLCAVSAPVIAPADDVAIDSLAPARSVLAAAALDRIIPRNLGTLPGRPRAPPATV
jgi:hypothetical protein